MPASRQKEKQASTSTESEQAIRPSWPVLKPLVPAEDLHLQEVFPNQIVKIPKFFTQSLCKKYVSFLSTLPLSTTPDKPKKGDAVRVNDRIQLEDPDFAQTLWEQTALKQLVLQTHAGKSGHSTSPLRDMWNGDVVGLNPNIRVYRYKAGQFFDRHYDDSNVVKFPSGQLARTTWTLLLYLTSPTTGSMGGETVFYPEPSSGSSKGKVEENQRRYESIVIGLETGMALLHKHGRDCMLHEGREVTQGEKWVIRSDICVKQ